MTCSEFAELLVGGTGLCDRLARALHARTCTTCRALVDDARTIDGALTALPRHAMPEGLDDRLLSVLGEDTAPGAVLVRRPTARGVKWGVLAAGAALVLAALPFLRGKPTSVLAQALDTLRDADAIHFVARPGIEGNEGAIEFWIVDEKHYRQEEREAGELTRIQIQTGDVLREYSAWNNQFAITEGQIGTGIHDFGQLLLYPDLLLPALAEHYRGDGFDAYEEERHVDGRGREVVAHTVSVESGPRQERVVVSLDAQSGAIVELVAETLVDGEWRRMMSFDDIDYGTPFPEDIFRLEPPDGATVIERTWWKTRKSVVLAEASVDGSLTIRVHSVDVRDNGDVVVSLSELAPPVPDGESVSFPMYGRLIDHLGRHYAQLPAMGFQPDATIADHVTVGEDGRLWWRGEIYHVLNFIPIEPTDETPESVDIELPPLPGAEDGGPLIFESLPVNVLPPGDPFQRVVRGKPLPKGRAEEQEEEDRAGAIERYHATYG